MHGLRVRWGHPALQVHVTKKQKQKPQLKMFPLPSCRFLCGMLWGIKPRMGAFLLRCSCAARESVLLDESTEENGNLESLDIWYLATKANSFTAVLLQGRGGGHISGGGGEWGAWLLWRSGWLRALRSPCRVGGWNLWGGGNRAKLALRPNHGLLQLHSRQCS